MKELFAIYDRYGMICFTFKDFLNTRIKRAIPAAEKLDFEALMQVSSPHAFFLTGNERLVMR